MIGVIVSLPMAEVKLAMLDWGLSIDPVEIIDLKEFKYVIVRDDGGNVKFVAAVGSVNIACGVSCAKWGVNFSEIYEVDSISIQLGDPAYGMALINSNQEKNIQSSLEGVSKIYRPKKIPTHLSIDEAVEALHNRYGILKEKISISLHN